MKDASDYRYENLLTVFQMFKDQRMAENPELRNQGMLRKFADHLGVNEAYMSHMTTGKRRVGQATARTVEQKMALPHGWMDQDHSPQVDVIKPVTPAQAKYVELALQQFEEDPVGAMGALMTYMAERQKKVA